MLPLPPNVVVHRGFGDRRHCAIRRSTHDSVLGRRSLRGRLDCSVNIQGLLMASSENSERKTRLPLIVRVFGYLSVQAFVLMLVTQLPWPVVDVLVFIATVRESATPDPVIVVFWAQLVVGLFLPLRGKAFLMSQFVLFVLIYFVFCEVEHRPNVADRAVLSFAIYGGYWVQFFATALGCMAWFYRRSTVRPWYPLIIYIALQLASLASISQIRFAVGADVRGWILIAFWGQCIGLLFAPNRVRLLIAVELLLGLSLSQLAHWLPMDWQSVTDSTSDFLWIVYALQCVGLSWWLFSHRRQAIAEKENHSPSAD